MSITNGYCDLTTFKAYMGITVSTMDSLCESAVNAASRLVDGYCQRRFWVDSSAVARTFAPKAMTYLDLEGDVSSASGLILKTDASGDGTFETTWAATDYQLVPVGAATAYPEAKPWTAIRAVGTKTFPEPGSWLSRADVVQVTALWGWAAVPDAVKQATLIKAARLFRRKDSPEGIAGFGEFGPVRLSRAEDPDVMGLLDPYRRMPVLVG